MEANVRKQECYAISVNGGTTHMNSQQEGEECQHCKPWGELPIVGEPVLRHKSTDEATEKEKGRVCLVEEGDSKEAEKGKEQTRGGVSTQHWSDGGWEELENPIT